MRAPLQGSFKKQLNTAVMIAELTDTILVPSGKINSTVATKPNKGRRLVRTLHELGYGSYTTESVEKYMAATEAKANRFNAFIQSFDRKFSGLRRELILFHILGLIGLFMSTSYFGLQLFKSDHASIWMQFGFWSCFVLLVALGLPFSFVTYFAIREVPSARWQYYRSLDTFGRKRIPAEVLALVTAVQARLPKMEVEIYELVRGRVPLDPVLRLTYTNDNGRVEKRYVAVWNESGYHLERN